MNWKPQEYSNIIKSGTTLNFFTAFSMVQLFHNIKNNVRCCSRSVKTKTMVNSGQLNVGV